MREADKNTEGSLQVMFNILLLISSIEHTEKSSAQILAFLLKIS